jgi:hypothetical protein
VTRRDFLITVAVSVDIDTGDAGRRNGVPLSGG